MACSWASHPENTASAVFCFYARGRPSASPTLPPSARIERGLMPFFVEPKYGTTYEILQNERAGEFVSLLPNGWPARTGHTMHVRVFAPLLQRRPRPSPHRSRVTTCSPVGFFRGNSQGQGQGGEAIAHRVLRSCISQSHPTLRPLRIELSRLMQSCHRRESVTNQRTPGIVRPPPLHPHAGSLPVRSP